MESSQFGSERPISCCRVHDSRLLTGCFGGELRLWDLASSNMIKSWRAHDDRICSVDWNPCGGNAMCASSSLDSPVCSPLSLVETAKLWGWKDDAPVLLHTLTGHLNRVTTVKFHPSGRCGE